MSDLFSMGRKDKQGAVWVKYGNKSGQKIIS